MNALASIKCSTGAIKRHPVIKLFAHGVVWSFSLLLTTFIPAYGSSFHDPEDIDLTEEVSVFKGWVGGSNSSDYYRFTLANSSDFSLSLTELADRADVGLLDNSGAVLIESDNYAATDQNIEVQLLPGTYYIRVNPSYSHDSTAYTLSVSASSVVEAGNSFNEARNILLTGDAITFRDWVGVTDTDDYYRFTLDRSNHVRLRLTEPIDRIVMELLDSSGAVVANWDNFVSSKKDIYKKLQRGTYFIRVRPAYSHDNTGYKLTVVAQPVPGEEDTTPISSNIFVEELRRDRSRGFVINGLEQDDRLGRSLAVGDINGDEYPDIVSGAWALRTVAPEDATVSDYHVIINHSEYFYSLIGGYALYGQGDRFADPVDPSDLDGDSGFVLKGKVEGLYATDEAGASVALWDADNDGLLDIVFGAPEGNTPFNVDAGKVYILRGRTDGFPARVELSQLDGEEGFTIAGVETNELLGFDISVAGDLNDDGRVDLVAGAPGRDSAYVFFGGQEFSVRLYVSQLNGATNGFRIAGNQGDGTGYSVSGGNDLNDDGINDLLVLSRSGRKAHLVYGRSGPFPSSIELDRIQDGYVSTLIFDRLFEEIAMVGDVNGDGLNEMALTGPDGTCLIYGKRGLWPRTIDLRNLGTKDGVKFAGFGGSVTAGDINGDGMSDLVIGDKGKEVNGKLSAGIAAVIYGSPEGLAQDIWGLDGRRGFIIAGSEPFNQIGAKVYTGDADGDGTEDVLVYGHDSPNGYSSGQVAVVYGKAPDEASP